MNERMKREEKRQEDEALHNNVVEAWQKVQELDRSRDSEE
jgi:hypothetical protein